MLGAAERGPGRPQRIVVAGGSGFIGSRLVERLASGGGRQTAITCLTRNPAAARAKLGNSSSVRFVEADLARDVSGALGGEGADVAYYLVHSMERSSRGGWKEFARRDREAAENFAAAAARWGVCRIIYLGGLHREGARLSEHMASRREVGQILARSSGASVTTFRAAVIIGWGGGSFEMLRYLVERLPVMVCPRWVMTRCQPIAVDDVVKYLARAPGVPEAAGMTIDIGGPDVLTYADMMRLYGRLIGRSPRIAVVPFLTPRLSSYWVELVTPVSASLSRPLIDSLKHEATVGDGSAARRFFPFRLKTFEEACRIALAEGRARRRVGTMQHAWH